MTWIRLIRSDWLKTKRTALRWALFAVPVGYAAILLWYVSNLRRTSELPDQIFGLFLEGGTVLLPIAVSVLAGLLCLQEERAGQFFLMLGSPVPRGQVYAAKLLLVSAVTAGGMLLSAATLLAGLHWGLQIGLPDVERIIQSLALAFLGALSIIALQLAASLFFGLGASVSIGGAGFLMAAIVGATSAGDRIWLFVPWAWPVRLSSLSETNAEQALDPGLAAAGLTFAVLAAGGAFWFQRWEGRQAAD